MKPILPHSRTLLAGVALAGLMSGSALRAQAMPSLGLTTSSHDGAAGLLADAAKNAKHGCQGQNACKGQGGCKSGDAGCKGKNTCKGKGGCATAGQT